MSRRGEGMIGRLFSVGLILALVALFALLALRDNGMLS